MRERKRKAAQSNNVIPLATVGRQEWRKRAAAYFKITPRSESLNILPDLHSRLHIIMYTYIYIHLGITISKAR